jgi:hypothetical protein
VTRDWISWTPRRLPRLVVIIRFLISHHFSLGVRNDGNLHTWIPNIEVLGLSR